MNVVAPSCEHGVRINTRMAPLLEIPEESFAHRVFQRLSSHREAIDNRVPDEGV
jgi:hypothetical protein